MKRLLSILAGLCWSRCTPSRPGYYFFHEFGVSQIVELVDVDGQLLVSCRGRGPLFRAENWWGWWRGPIRVPATGRWLESALPGSLPPRGWPEGPIDRPESAHKTRSHGANSSPASPCAPAPESHGASSVAVSSGHAGAAVGEAQAEGGAS